MNSTYINVNCSASHVDSTPATAITPANVAVRNSDIKSRHSYASNMDSTGSKKTRFKHEEIESKIIATV